MKTRIYVAPAVKGLTSSSWSLFCVVNMCVYVLYVICVLISVLLFVAICPAGEARSSDTTCKPCEMGWYREEGTDSATCVQCDSGERTDSTGATHSYMCKCKLNNCM